MKIAVGSCVFIEDRIQLPEFEKMMNSVKNFQCVIIVNGRWNDYDSKLLASITEVSEIIRKYPNAIEIKFPFKTEAESRNEYLITAGRLDYDALLIIDSDEYLVYDDNFENNLLEAMRLQPDKESFKVTLNSQRSGGDHWPPRIILNPRFCRYSDKHNEIYHGTREILHDSGNAVKGIKLFEDRIFRNLLSNEKMNRRNIDNPRH